MQAVIKNKEMKKCNKRAQVKLLLTLYRKDNQKYTCVRLYMVSLFHLVTSQTYCVRNIFTAAFRQFHFLHFLKLPEEI